MKKKALLILAVILLSFAVSCTSAEEHPGTQEKNEPTLSPAVTSMDITEEYTILKVFAMNGPTGMGFAKLVNDDIHDENNYRYSVSFFDSTESEMSRIISGDYDIICVPTNFAAILNTKAGGLYKIAAVNTLGVLSVLENGNTIKSIADLRGKTILSTGEGLIPGFVLEYVLTKNGLKPGEDVEIEYCPTPAEVGSMLMAKEGAVAMLPQPYVSALTLKNDGLSIVLDMTKEFTEVSDGDTGLMTSCICVKNDTYLKHPLRVKAFLKEISDSISYVNSNPKKCSVIIADLYIVENPEIAEKAIPLCNMVYIDGEKMKNALNGFYKELFAFKPALCGGKLPGNEIYLD